MVCQPSVGGSNPIAFVSSFRLATGSPAISCRSWRPLSPSRRLPKSSPSTNFRRQCPGRHRKWGIQNDKNKCWEIPLRQRLTQSVAPREFMIMLRLVESGKLRVSEKTRRPSGATLDAILPLMVDGDFYQPEERLEYAKETGQDLLIRPFAWPCILQAAGLVSLAGGRLELSSEGRKALSRDPHAAIRDAWKKWQNTKFFDEFERVETIKGKAAARLSAVVERRRAVTSVLATCPPDAWIEVDEFFRYLKTSGEDFTLARKVWNLYIVDSNYGSFGYDEYQDLAVA